MPKLTLTQGLPSSGKTTWALAELKRDPKAIRVNRDSLRLMQGVKYDPKNEDRITVLSHGAAESALRQGYNVIVDDTNLKLKHIQVFTDLAARYNAEFCLNSSFLDVTVEECIQRDIRREPSVGKDVIERMYYDYWASQQKPRNTGLRPAIICDLDGTLALIPKGANPYKRDFLLDGCNQAVKTVLQLASRHGDQEIIVTSGRSAEFRDVTSDWFNVWDIEPAALIMRERGDVRRDTVVKKEMYMEHIQGRYRVEFVLDDRPSVVRMWRAELGLTVFQVGPSIEF